MAAKFAGYQHTRYIIERYSDISSRVVARAGDDTQLVVYEALPHAFWYHYQLPETKEALDVMAKFFDEKLRR
jgi:epsilon-lactone hydrolase